MSSKVYYNKLVRDNIPEIIRAKGSECEVRELSEEEFKAALRKKVGEEASALPGATTKEELVSELADVMAVIEELLLAEDITDEELTDAMEKNEDRKGGFTKRLFLEWSSDDGYRTNETTT